MSSATTHKTHRNSFDLVVIGAGAAGMAASATGASHGLGVLLLEASPNVGGTTALSAGSLWVPNTDLAQDDDPQAAARYLDAVVGNWSRAELRSAFLAHGPEMVAELQKVGALDLAPYPYHPDYLSEMPGAVTSGRALGATTFDGRKLGRHFALLRPPLPEFTIFGGMMVDRTDINHLLNATRKPKSFLHAAGLILRHAWDRLSAPRGRRLVMGNALTGRLLAYLVGQGVTIRTGATVSEIVVEDGRAAGVVVDGERIAARRGVIVSTGGFSHNARLRNALYPQPVADHSAVPVTNAGGGVELLLAAGGHLDTDHANAAFWAPASVRQRSDGSRAVFPHFVLDRAKPGVIAVDGEGKRFVDESTSYQRFVEGMYRAGAIPCHLVCNGDFIRRYGLGVIRPMTRNLKPWVAEGYLQTGRSVEDLARVIGADPVALADSFARNDRYAAQGEDPDFGRGATRYARNLGDPAHKPNPCLGPMGEGPYYALAIHPADIGTSIGIETDTEARVLGAEGKPINGLYAAGNDMASVMGGTYPGPGITIGPAMTFGYVAARHAALKKEDEE
jgi:succinate dehydrogenase/fumarate reductase flavoprotein subunit